MRAENGTMRFGDDWCGIFLRGDRAAPMGMYLTRLLDMLEKGEQPHPIMLLQMRGFANLLGGCDERTKPTDAQEMRPFEECVKR